MRLRILDLDGSVAGQPAMRQRVARRQAQVIDLGHLASRLRLWSTSATMRQLRQNLREAGSPRGCGPIVTFYGSGDFHHLTPELMGDQDRPFVLVHFDNHPDWMRFAPRYHCGSWVIRALAMQTVQRVVTIGPCSPDLGRPQLTCGNLGALVEGRLEMHPWRHGSSFVLPGFDLPPHRRDGWKLHWECVGDDWTDFIEQLTRALPALPVWITIDKDVLRPQDAVTNWDQGEMPVGALEHAIRRIASVRFIIGVDVCGEYSPIAHSNPLKRYEAWIDQPSVPVPNGCQVNAATNERLLALFEDVLG